MKHSKKKKNELANIQEEYPIGINSSLIGKGYIQIGAFREEGHEFMRVTFPITQFESKKYRLRNYYEYFNKKEFYYVTAINNLLRQTNFLESCQQLIEKQIDDKEFNEELKIHSHKYTITIHDMEDEELKIDIPIILDIFKKIDPEIKELSVDDVGELFSINTCKLLEYTTRFVDENGLVSTDK